MSTLLKPKDTEVLSRNWLEAVEQLYGQISDWAQSQHWIVSYSDTEVAENQFGAYTMPVMQLEVPEIPEGRLILEPQAVNAGGKGRIKMYATSTLYRVRLLNDLNNTNWTVLTDSGIPLHSPWGQDTFVTLAKDLLGAD